MCNNLTRFSIETQIQLKVIPELYKMSSFDYFNNFCQHILKEITGIIHVGAHTCEERDVYIDLFRQSDDSILWIDAFPEVVMESQRAHPNAKIVCACCSDKDGEGTLYLSNYSRCTGLLPFTKEHKEAFPTITQMELTVPYAKLDTLIPKQDRPLRNMLAISVNGAELKVCKGAETLLEFIDFVVIKSEKYVFHEGRPSLRELDEWLGVNGFSRVACEQVNDSNDALLYVSLDVEEERKKQEKRMTDMFQLMVEEYNATNGTEVKTEVYSDD